MTAVPVVLVHGSMHGAWCWDHVRDELSVRGVPSVAVELPGHGARAEESAAASLTAYADAVHDAIAAAGAPVVLIGHSMAGHVVARVAVERPDTVACLVLVNGQVLVDGETHFSMLPADVRAHYAGLIRDQGGSTLRLSDEEIHARWLQDLSFDDPLVQRTLRLITPQPVPPLKEPAVGQRLASISVPVIYIRSTDDAGPPERMDRFVARLPDRATVVSVPGSHDCMISRPAELSAVLADAAAKAWSTAA